VVEAALSQHGRLVGKGSNRVPRITGVTFVGINKQAAYEPAVLRIAIPQGPNLLEELLKRLDQRHLRWHDHSVRYALWEKSA
jgi:hypothetical protein